ncbi:hypothetical protein AGMMS50293_02210 [Spirochaetia bacterium]|nr:hypothetical protein AGMMS50293_02210 [Spirochaetia bacterium]
MKKKARFAVFIFALVIAAGIVSCGLEDYPYLPSVPENNITVQSVNRATIRLPNISSSYFTHFTIFYRIYISGENTDQITTTDLSRVNTSLAADYNGIYPSTDITNTSANTAIGSLFRNRRYYELQIEGGDIRNLLSAGSTVEIIFPTITGEKPTLNDVNGNVYGSLYRSNGEGIFDPVPDRYFLNSPDLNASANTIETKNADVANNTSIVASSSRYTYVSLYIVLVGLDTQTLTSIYSQPTFIGILKLPEK